jgi:hypothetical protein
MLHLGISSFLYFSNICCRTLGKPPNLSKSPSPLHKMGLEFGGLKTKMRSSVWK